MQSGNSKSKKICLLGASGVGKTSLVKRFVEGIFDETYRTTIGVQLYDKLITCDEGQVKLNVWDLEGKDDPQHVQHDDSLENANGYILVADVTRPNTLHVVKNLLETSKRHSKEEKSHPFVLLINKQDIPHSPAVTTRAIEIFGDSSKIFETSAKTGERVNEAFDYLAKQMLELDRRCGSQTEQFTDDDQGTLIDLNNPKSYEVPILDSDQASTEYPTLSPKEKSLFNALYTALDSLVLERCTDGHAFLALHDVPEWARCLIKMLPNQPNQDLWTETSSRLKHFMVKASAWWSKHETGETSSGWCGEKWPGNKDLDLEYIATAIGHQKLLVIKRLAPTVRDRIQNLRDKDLVSHAREVNNFDGK